MTAMPSTISTAAEETSTIASLNLLLRGPKSLIMNGHATPITTTKYATRRRAKRTSTVNRYAKGIKGESSAAVTSTGACPTD